MGAHVALLQIIAMKADIPSYLIGKDCGDFTLWFEEERDFVDGPHGAYIPICNRALYFIETKDQTFDDAGDWEEYSSGEFQSWDELQDEL